MQLPSLVARLKPASFSSAAPFLDISIHTPKLHNSRPSKAKPSLLFPSRTVPVPREVRHLNHLGILSGVAEDVKLRRRAEQSIEARLGRRVNGRLALGYPNPKRNISQQSQVSSKTSTPPNSLHEVHTPNNRDWG